MSNTRVRVADGVDFVLPATARRDFLKMLGMAGVAFALPPLVAACGSDKTTGPGSGVTLDFGTDFGVLNYAYALEQLEAAFYTKVVGSFYSGASTTDMAVLNDIKQHETLHRDFLKAALAANAIPALSVDFSSIDFTSRTSVLTAAKAFEDTGVSAYNGAAGHLKSANYLLIAGKIVSVEARHASAIRDLLAPRTAAFAGDDVVSSTGLDLSNPPSTVLGASGAGPFVKTKITVVNY